MWIALNFDAWLWPLCSFKMERTTTMTIHFHVRIQTQSLNWMFMIFYTLRGEDVAVWGLPVTRMKDVWYLQLKHIDHVLILSSSTCAVPTLMISNFLWLIWLMTAWPVACWRTDVSWLNSFKVSWLTWGEWAQYLQSWGYPIFRHKSYCWLCLYYIPTVSPLWFVLHFTFPIVAHPHSFDMCDPPKNMFNPLLVKSSCSTGFFWWAPCWVFGRT